MMHAALCRCALCRAPCSGNLIQKYQYYRREIILPTEMFKFNVEKCFNIESSDYMSCFMLVASEYKTKHCREYMGWCGHHFISFYIYFCDFAIIKYVNVLISTIHIHIIVCEADLQTLKLYVRQLVSLPCLKSN